MDSIDLAQELNNKFLEECISNVSMKMANIMYNDQEKDKKGRIICKSCGVPIPKKRLKAIPYAIYCVACQEELEEEIK